MTTNTNIEWADHTFNPWTGCQAISPGCKNCYAEAWAKRSGRDFATPQHTKTWGEPVRWNARHAEFFAEHGRRQRVFCASLGDVFDNRVDPRWRAELFWLIAATPKLDWLLLTKRIGNAASMTEQALRSSWDRPEREPPLWRTPWPWPNVWLGATVVNQEEADRDIPKLLQAPACVRFLSIEPMLGDIRLCSYLQHSPSAAFVAGRVTPDMPAWTRIGSAAVDWVICGGESGPRARPMHPDWPRSLRDECAAAGVPFLFKQWGEWREPRLDESFDTSMGRAQKVPAFIVAPRGTVHCFENDETQAGGKPMLRVSKKSAGRALDGVEHNGFPAREGVTP
jgi:protein gp37